MKLLIFCRRAKELARRVLHGWYEKSLAVEDLLAEADGGRFTWIGAGAERAGCCAAGPGLLDMQRAQDELPALTVEEETWHFQPLAPDAGLVFGRFRLATAPESGLVLSEQQRATFLFRAEGNAVRLCHVHISSPAGRKRRTLYAFEEPAVRRDYMGELAARRLGDRFPELTKRQVKVLCFLVQGLPYKEIADAMNITPRTVRYYVTEIERRLRVENRTLLIEEMLQRNTGGDECLWVCAEKDPARVFFCARPYPAGRGAGLPLRHSRRAPLWFRGVIKKIYTDTSGTAVEREVKENGGNSYNFLRFIVVSWQTTKEGGICMKMKKAYAAALAAAMVLTAGFSVQAQVVDNSLLIDSTDGTTHAYVQGGSIDAGVVDNEGNSHGVKIDANGTTVDGGAIVNGGATVNGSTQMNGSTFIDAADGTHVYVQSGAITAGLTNSSNGEYHGLMIDANGTTVDGGATVTGGLTADNATVTGSLTAGSVNTDVITSGTGDTVTVDAGTVVLGGDDTGSHTTVSGDLTVNSGAVINGGATVSGGLIADTATVTGNAIVGGDVYVAGRTEGVGASLNAHDALIKENASAIQQQGNAISSLNSRVSDLGDEIDNVGAISSALAGLHPLDYDGTGSKFQLAAAMGSYDGSQAAAIGGFYHFNEDIMMSVGGATAFDGDSDTAFNVGVSFRVGQGSSGKKVNSDDVLAQLNAMNEKIAALEAENQSLSEKVAALEGSEAAPAEAE